MSFSLGARRSHPAKLAKARPAALHPTVYSILSGILVPGHRPAAYLPPRQDQDGTSECTAHAMSGALSATCAAHGAPLGFIPSQRALYAASGAMARAAAIPAGNTLPALQDDGRELADVVAAVASIGVKAQRDPDPSRNSDATPDNATEEPDVSDLEAADPEKLSGAHMIDMAAPNAVQVACAALDGGIALYTGFFVDRAFQALGPNDVAQAPDQTETGSDVGGHAVFLADYRTNAAGDVELLLVNSWGTGFALDGTVWVSTAWVLAAWEIWLIDESLLAGARRS